MSGARIRNIAARAKNLKRQAYVLYLSYRDPRTPLYAKLFAMVVTAYAFSPVDLIPDFIPVLGLLDEMVLVPLGVALALRMLPKQVLEEVRARADVLGQPGKPVQWMAGGLIMSLWMAAAGWVMLRLFR